MTELSFKRHRFPPQVIRHTIWLYARFTLSLRDVEEMLAERGVDVSYETVRRWFMKFGPKIAANLRRLRPRPSDHWHLDEMVVTIKLTMPCECKQASLRKNLMSSGSRLVTRKPSAIFTQCTVEDRTEN